MKKISYILSIFVIMLSLIINGEIFQFYMNDFEAQFDHTTFYLQDYQEQDQMITDLMETSKECNVDIFTVSDITKSAFSAEKIFYCDEGSEKYIKENFDLENKEYRSIISGKTSIVFKRFEDIPDISLQNTFYLLGTKEDQVRFKEKTVNDYAGKFPQQGNKSSECLYLSISIWVLAGIVIIFLRIFNVNSQKKEFFLRVSFGENKWKLILSSAFADILLYTVTYILAFLLLKHITNVYFNLNVSVIAFAVIMILYFALSFSILRFEIREIFSNTKISSGLLNINYILKGVSCVLTAVIISGNVVIIRDGLEYYSQRSFFEKYSDHSYVYLDYKLYLDKNDNIVDRAEEGTVVRENFYRKFFNKFDATMIVPLSFEDDLMLCNRNSLDYLKENIKELNDTELDKGVYFILPEDADDSCVEMLNDYVSTLEGDEFSYDHGIIHYDEDIKLIAIDGSSPNGSVYKKDPIIIYNNTDVSNAAYSIPYENSCFKLDYEKDIMYRISEDEFENFVSENHLDNQIVSVTNVMDSFDYHWNFIKRTMLLSIFLGVMILILEYAVIRYVIRLEYEANAIELSVKKILGYSKLEKNRKLFIITSITFLISMIAAIVICSVIQRASAVDVMLSGAILLLLEMLTIIQNINKIEQTNVPKILKGGSL